MPRDKLYSLASALAIVACVAAAYPVLEMGVNDDWSYTWTALKLAQTGHLIYSGWSEPMVGVQAIPAAALIRLFGFSFTMVRLSALAFAAGCGWLAFKLGRCAGLNPQYAAFGALTLTASPLFIPLSASFMTDIPSLFFWLACVYCALRAVDSGCLLRTGAWMAAAAAVGVAGGSVRQVIWMIPLAALPAVAWLRRRERAVTALAALAWCASAAASWLCLRWFLAQPYVRLLSGSEAPGGWKIFQYALASVVWLTVGGAVFLLPIFAAQIADWKKENRARRDIWIGVASVAALAVLHWLFHQDLLVGNTVTLFGMLTGVGEALGSRPVVLGAVMRAVLKLAVAAGGVVSLTALAGMVRRGGFRRIAHPHAGAADARPIRFLWIMGLPCALYAILLLYRGILFDRYLVPLLPLAITVFLWRQQKLRSSPPPAAWAMLCVAALYGVATTHDYFAGARARHDAVSALAAAGVPRSSITVGLEGDAWAELEQAGHIAAAVNPEENRNRKPTRPGPAPTDRPDGWFWIKVPSIHPVYYVTYSRFTDLRDAAVPAAYRTWLPPGERQVFTEKAP